MKHSINDQYEELWKQAEKGELEHGTIFEDEDGNQIIFTGHSFQVYYTENNTEERYVGLSVGDRWRAIAVDTSVLVEVK